MTGASDDVWGDAAARLVAAGMAQVDGDGCLVPTPRGSKTASSGLSVRSASAVVRALCACAPVIGHDVAVWTAFLASLPEMADTGNWTLSGRGRVTLSRVDAEWRERFGEGFLESVARRFPDDPGAVTVHFSTSAKQQRAMVTALVMEDWAAGTATHDLERHYHLPIGRIEPAADALGWLFETTAALAETISALTSSGLIAQLRRAAFEIGHGMRHDCAALIETLGGLVPRQTLLDLIARGWDDPIALSHRQRVDLAGIAPPGIVEEMLRRCRAYASTHTPDSESETKTGASTGSLPRPGRGQRRLPLDHSHNSKNAVASDHDQAAAREDIMSPILHLNGAPVPANGGRMSIELAGRPLTLRLKSFKYLLALATARCLSRDGWIAKADIEAGENQIKYLYQLRRELAAAGHLSGNLIENDGNGHYRLTLPPQALRFDLPRLAEHADWDIRTLAQRLLSTQAAAA